MIHDEAQLEDLLSQPTEADIAAMQEIGGDILILGAGGKMGPTLAVRARRAMTAAGKPHRIIAVARFTNAALVQRLRAENIETITCDMLQPGALSGLPTRRMSSSWPR
jgi:hypothetical protein